MTAHQMPAAGLIANTSLLTTPGLAPLAGGFFGEFFR